MKRISISLCGVVILLVLLSSAVRESHSAESAKKARYAKDQKVELFTTVWCGYCAMARKFFRDRGIEFVDYDVEKSEAAALRRIRLYGRGGVPLAVINGTPILGFSEEAYEEALIRE